MERSSSIWRRIASVFTGRSPAGATAPGGAPPRWPHLRRGWLDPDVLLQGFRTTVDLTDLDDALRGIASASGGRLGAPEIAEMADVVHHSAIGAARALRFGRTGPNAFGQIWVGAVRSDAESVRLFLLGDQDFADGAAAALSLAGFQGTGKRAEFEALHRFFVAAWDWRWTEGPERVRRTAPPGIDPRRLAEGMDRFLSAPGAPLLEAMRGLRKRIRDLLELTADLDPAELERADAFLSARGAPTLTEMRRRLARTSDAS